MTGGVGAARDVSYAGLAGEMDTGRELAVMSSSVMSSSIVVGFNLWAAGLLSVLAGVAVARLVAGLADGGGAARGDTTAGLAGETVGAGAGLA